MTQGQAEAVDVPSDLEKKIIRQVEYYFGDANMARDKFLLEQIKKDDGWVSFEVLCTFNRLKQLSDDRAVIAAALRKSDAGLLQVSDDGASVRRSPHKPLPELNKERREDLASRSVYCKRFPLETSLEKLQEYFAQFGEVEQIQMRKNLKKAFKGSVFALFAMKEDAKKFLESEAVPFDGTALEARMTRDAYHKLKNEQRRKNTEEREKGRQQEMKLREAEEDQKIAERITPGAILHLTWAAGSGSLDVPNLKEFFSTFGKVAWVDAPKDAAEAYVRFDTGIAQQAWDAAVKASDNGSVVVKAVSLTGNVLTGDAETDHWKQIFQDKKDKAKGASGGRRGGRGGGRGHGRGRGRGGRGGGGDWRSGRRGEKRSSGKDAAEEAADSGDAAAAATSTVDSATARPSDESAPEAKRAKVDSDQAAPASAASAAEVTSTNAVEK